MVPAASGGTSSPPAALEHCSVPETGGVLTESIRGQITDLQPGELTEELLERHPDTHRQTGQRSASFLLRGLANVEGCCRRLLLAVCGGSGGVGAEPYLLEK